MFVPPCLSVLNIAPLFLLTKKRFRQQYALALLPSSGVLSYHKIVNSAVFVCVFFFVFFFKSSMILTVFHIGKLFMIPTPVKDKINILFFCVDSPNSGLCGSFLSQLNKVGNTVCLFLRNKFKRFIKSMYITVGTFGQNFG